MRGTQKGQGVAVVAAVEAAENAAASVAMVNSKGWATADATVIR